LDSLTTNLCQYVTEETPVYQKLT